MKNRSHAMFKENDKSLIKKVVMLLKDQDIHTSSETSTRKVMLLYEQVGYHN